MSLVNALNYDSVNATINSNNTQIDDVNATSSKSDKNFDSVILQALENANGKRPEHICCAGNSKAEENISESNIIDSQDLVNNIENTSSSSATEDEKLTAGTCFTMFIRISTRITTEVSEVVGGKFNNTTLAFADALRKDRFHNENLLESYLQKTNDMISNQTEELKSYIESYLDNMFSAVKSSLSGLNSTLLGSSNLLGNSLSSYTNLLPNSTYGNVNSLASSLLSGFSSTLNKNSNSSSLAGYAAIDVANTQLNAMINGTSNYTYGIGTTLNRNRYAGRNLSIIKSSEIEVSAKGGLAMVDTKGKETTGVAPTGVEIGNSSSNNLSKVSELESESSKLGDSSDSESLSNNSDSLEKTEEVVEATSQSENESDVEKNNEIESQKEYFEAFMRKNRIIDLFKEMILGKMDNKKEDIKNIITNININFA